MAEQLLIGNGGRYALQIFAQALRPAPPVDLVTWARSNVRFGPESPFPGPFDPGRFPFYDRLLEVLSPDHPARVVVLRGSAQIGKTVIAEIFLGATEDLDPGPFMFVHPTESNAHRWVRTKWWPMIRSTTALTRIFESRSSKEGGTSLMLQERRDGRGMLIVSGANSASSLSMISVRRQVQDDLSKWANLPEGDPEGLADDRSKAFAWGKIFKVSTPHLANECRITEAFKRGTQEHFHVPCPQCGHKHPLDWNEFRARVEENPASAYFVCPECGGVIEEKHRGDIIAKGEWVAHNSNPTPGWVSFHLWAAYAGLESWDTLAQLWHAAKGDPADEQRELTNTTGGEPYELAGEAPAWEDLKKRAEDGKRRRGIVPIGALLLTLTLDCQDEWIDGVVVGWGRDLRRWVVDQVRVEGHISTPETRAELNQVVDRAWPTDAGSRRRVDLAGIDANAWTDDVFDWAKNFPKSRVVMVRGVGGDVAPTLAPVRKERRRDGKLVKYQGRFFNVGVSGLKAGLYKFLRVEDPDQRGHVSFPAGLEEDYFAQLTAEKRTPVVDRKGFTSYAWVKPRSARNEQLDVMTYAEALAGRLGWRTLTPIQWAALEAEREVAAAHSAPQSDLFATPQIARSTDTVSVETEIPRRLPCRLTFRPRRPRYRIGSRDLPGGSWAEDAVCKPDDLRAIAAALESGLIEGVSNPAKVAEEFRRYLAEARDGLRLEVALELTPAPGKRAWWTKEAEKDRNDHIRQWACDLSGLSLRKKAQLIARLGRDYQTRGFRLDQGRQVVEASSGDADRRRMRAILETGAPFPGVREIQTILSVK